MSKTLIVPGLDGSPAPHWQHWWAQTDPEAVMVELTDPHNPVPEVWEIELGGMILRHPDCVLVGHSLGSVLIARMLQSWPQLRVRAALLVAPAETESSSRLSRFGRLPEQRLGVPTTVVASRNDPWMPISRARQLARAWEADFVDLGYAGHVNTAAGYGPWEAGKDLRDDLMLRSAPVTRVFGPAGISRAAL